MNYEMNDYEKKVKAEWVCPKEINPTKVEYAFMYEFAVVLADTVWTLVPQTHEAAAFYGKTTSVNIDGMEQLLQLYKRFGVYKIDTLVDHFEVHAVAFDLHFDFFESGYFHNVKIVKQQVIDKVYGADDWLLIDFKQDGHCTDMYAKDWTVLESIDSCEDFQVEG